MTDDFQREIVWSVRRAEKVSPQSTRMLCQAGGCTIVVPRFGHFPPPQPLPIVHHAEREPPWTSADTP